MATQPIAGARARAHAEVRAEILAAAARQVARSGPSTLSLRAVARELGMVSSALYRYFTSRDELLTALIVEAYDSLGAHTERAVANSRRRPGLARWVDAAAEIRSWAVKRPHDYALLYGSPVPGYAAPTTTIDPGTRPTRALISIVGDAADDGQLEQSRSPVTDFDRSTHESCEFLRTELRLDLSDTTIVAVILAWTQLFGLLSFELFGQTKGLIDNHDAFLRESATIMGARIGLR